MPASNYYGLIILYYYIRISEYNNTGHERTTNAAWWWGHLEQCDGEVGDPEQKAAAKRGAAEALAKVAAKKARKDDQQRIQQQQIQAGGLPAAFRTDLKKQADSAVGRFLFANGLPLRYIVTSMTTRCTHRPSRYQHMPQHTRINDTF